MKLKELILITLLLTISPITFSQVEVLQKWESDGGKHTAYFVYRDSDEKHIAEMKGVIEKVWTISKVEMVSIEAFFEVEMKPGDFSMLMGLSQLTSVSEGGVASNFVDLYLDVRMKTEKNQEILGRITLSPNGQTVFDVCRGPESLEQVVYNQYKYDSNFSWNFPYLSAGLATLAKALTEGEMPEIKEDFKNPELPNIKNATLYISDAVNIDQNRFNGKDSESDKKESITKSYPYKFEILNDETINSKYLNGEMEYLFMSQKIGKGKYLIVINVKENRFVYIKLEKGRYNFSAKDIKELAAHMGK